MNRFRLLLKSTFVVAAMVGAAGCSSEPAHDNAQQQRPPTPQEEAARRSEAERQDYVQRTQARIDEMAKTMATLRTQAAQTAQPQRKKSENAADDMDALLRDARKELNDVKNSSPEAWHDEKRDVDTVMARAETRFSLTKTLVK